MKITGTAMVAVLLWATTAHGAGLLRSAEFFDDPTTPAGGDWLTALGGGPGWEQPNDPATGIGAYNNIGGDPAVVGNRNISNCNAFSAGTEPCGPGGHLDARSIEARIKAIETSGGLGGVAVDWKFPDVNPDPGAHRAILNLLNEPGGIQGVVLQDGGTGATASSATAADLGINMGEFNTYGISLVDPSTGEIDIYINGAVVPSLNATLPSAGAGLAGFEGEISFGDIGTNPLGNAEFEYVRVFDNPDFIPEPASLGLLALGGVLAMRRRR